MASFLKIVVFGVFLATTTAKLTDFIKPCSAKDPQLNACVLAQAKLFYPSLVKGIKEFGIYPLEPLSVPLLNIDQGERGISFNISDSKQYGWDNTQYTNASVDLKKHHFEFDILNHVYSLVGNYTVSGRILVLPIRGSGFSNMTFVNISTKITIDGVPEKRNGKTFLKLTKVRTTYNSYDKLFIRMDNLFGNKELSDAMNVFLNSNSKEVFKDLEPAMEDVLSEIYFSLMTRLFSRMPYNQMFRDLE